MYDTHIATLVRLYGPPDEPRLEAVMGRRVCYCPAPGDHDETVR